MSGEGGGAGGGGGLGAGSGGDFRGVADFGGRYTHESLPIDGKNAHYHGLLYYVMFHFPPQVTNLAFVENKNWPKKEGEKG